MNKKFLILVSFLVFLYGCGKSEHVKNEPVAVKVKIEKVETDNGGCTSFYSGTVKEENASLLNFSVMGTVSGIHVGLGTVVHKGQLLATIDDTSLKSAYEAAKAARDQAEDAYSRMKELHQKGSLADIKWMEVKSKYQQACSMEEMAKKQLADCRLYAPFSGVISSKSIEVGQNVNPAVPAFTLVSGKDMNVRISVPETEISNVYKGQEAVVIIPALNDSRLEGSVIEKGIQANPVSRSYEVKIRLDNSSLSGKVMPGMITEVYLTGKLSTQHIVIAANLIQIDENNNYFVWLNDKGKASKRIIACGDFTPTGVTVVSGLNAGDEIIVEGQQKVCEGTKLEL